MTSLLDTLNSSISNKVLKHFTMLVNGFNFLLGFLLTDSSYIDKKHWNELIIARQKAGQRKKSYANDGVLHALFSAPKKENCQTIGEKGGFEENRTITELEDVAGTMG